MDINLHYLELFYHVGKHGGPRPASRKMKWGIQPSAISKQLCRLEKETGLCLYERQPFKLTPAGQKLFAHIKPFMEDLPELVVRLRQGEPEAVRLGASAVVLRDYLPSILRRVQQGFPGLRLTFQEGHQGQIATWLNDKAIDVAVTVLEGDIAGDYPSEPLLQLPMILLVPDTSPFRSVGDLWKTGRVTETLIGFPAHDSITRLFRQGLMRKAIEWSVGVEANSISLVENLVQQGFGIGMSVDLPGRRVPTGLRALALPEFPAVTVGIIWRTSPTMATQALVNEFRREAAQWITPSPGLPGKVSIKESL